MDRASLPDPPGFLNGPWIQVDGGQPKAHRLAIRVNVDIASLPDPPGFLE